MIRSLLSGAAFLSFIFAAGTPFAQADSLEHPNLRFDISMGKGIGTGNTAVNGARFSVDILTDGKTDRIWSKIYGKLDQWYPVSLDLEKYAGKTVTVRLVVEHIDNRICQDYPFWGDPRIIMPSDDGKDDAVSDRLALRTASRVGVILKNGVEEDLADPARFFGTEGRPLITPAKCSLKYNAMVYGGTVYITVGGKNQPGIYMGFDMSHGFGGFEMPEAERQEFLKKYRGGVQYSQNTGVDVGEPYIGATPPPVFAEWSVSIPQSRPAKVAEVASQNLVTKPIKTSDQAILIRNVFDQKSQGNRKVKLGFDRAAGTLSMEMAGGSGSGWGFSAVELSGLKKLDLKVDIRTGDKETAKNRMAGLVIDFRTPEGYLSRYFLGDSLSGQIPDDLRPAAYYLSDGSYGAKQRLQQSVQSIPLSEFQKSGSEYSIPLEKLAPPNWDGHLWLGVGLLNTQTDSRISVQLSDDLIPAKTKEAAHPLNLISKNSTVSISEQNGAIVSMAGAGEKGTSLLGKGNDGYSIQRKYFTEESSEDLDRVISKEAWQEGNDRIVQFACTNLAFPDLKIRKTYRLSEAEGLSKTVSLEVQDGEGIFASWTSKNTLDTAFLKDAKWSMGMGPTTRVAVGKVFAEGEDAPPAEQAGIHEPAFYFNNKTGTGIGVYRWKVNGRFVLLGGSKKTSDGWELAGAQAWLAPGKPPLTVEIRMQTEKQGYLEFFDRYNKQPEVMALNSDLTVPNWVKYLVCDGMYYSPAGNAIAGKLAPYTSTTAIWFLATPWGDWGADHEIFRSKHQDVFGLTREAHSLSPETRVSAYHCFAFDEDSDFFKNGAHVGLHNRDGELLGTGISSDTTRGPAYSFQVGDPAVRAELVAQHVARMKQWEFGYLYFDGPGWGLEVADWGRKIVAQSYDWIDYLKETHAAIQEWDSDAVIFSNGIIPYSQIGYVEFRTAQWNQLNSDQWRPIAAQLLKIKYLEPRNFTWVPTYGLNEADPMLAAYTLLYGWAGILFNSSRVPWMLAAWELRWSKMHLDAVSPFWLNDPTTSLEAYGFSKGDVAVVGVIDHDPNRKENYTVDADLAKLGLSSDLPIRAWDFNMLAPEQHGQPTGEESPEVISKNLAVTPMEGRYLGEERLVEGKIKCNFPPGKNLPQLRLLTHLPVVLKEVGGVTLKMGLPTHPGVSISWSKNGENEKLVVVSREKCVLAMPASLAEQFEIAGCPTSGGDWLGNPATLLALNSGRTEISLAKRLTQRQASN